jgi:hypothetical protein
MERGLVISRRRGLASPEKGIIPSEATIKMPLQGQWA